MKYVAFLDILGFKDKLKKLRQNEAVSYIASYSSLAYNEFLNHENYGINGFIVSDSIILHTESTKESELARLVDLIDSICRHEFAQNGILIRGAIAKGDFDSIPAKELTQLRKELIVGQAYVDAYLMEGSVKALGIVLGNEVRSDLINIGRGNNIVEEQVDQETKYIYNYLTIDFFMNEENLIKFVRRGVEANWLPHYYNTLYFAMKKEKNDPIDFVFDRIIGLLRDGYEWRKYDQFIRNSFNDKVFSQFQTRFLRFLRNKIS